MRIRPGAGYHIAALRNVVGLHNKRLRLPDSRDPRLAPPPGVGIFSPFRHHLLLEPAWCATDSMTACRAKRLHCIYVVRFWPCLARC